MARPVPTSIQTTDQEFDIVWEDGHRSLYPHKFLRANCQCAHCVDELTRQRRVGPADVRDDIRAEDWMEVGRYAIQILWSDAHATGIYPFDLLRALCPCGACEATRQARRSQGDDASIR